MTLLFHIFYIIFNVGFVLEKESSSFFTMFKFRTRLVGYLNYLK